MPRSGPSAQASPAPPRATARHRSRARRATVRAIRGHAEITIVDGVVDEYLAAARETMDAAAAAAFEQHVRTMYEQMARIAITPRWARFYDFGAGRLPGFLTELANKAGV